MITLDMTGRSFSRPDLKTADHLLPPVKMLSITREMHLELREVNFELREVNLELREVKFVR